VTRSGSTFPKTLGKKTSARGEKQQKVQDNGKEILTLIMPVSELNARSATGKMRRKCYTGAVGIRNLHA
jgi:hypothetical protein